MPGLAGFKWPVALAAQVGKDPKKEGLRPYAGQAETQPSVGRALGPHALSGECPPASACGRHLPLYFASKGMGAQRPTH